MDQFVREQLEDLVFIQLKVITGVTIARHLDISTDEANKILKEFYALHEKEKSIYPIYMVNGKISRNGSDVKSIIMVKQEKLDEAISMYTNKPNIILFALCKDPDVDITTILAHDSLEDAEFFREDGRRTGISSVQVRKFREEMEAENKEAAARQKAILDRGPSAMAAASNLQKKEIKQEEKTLENKRMTNLFQKACDRQKTPKSSPTKVRDSPFSSAEKKDDSNDSMAKKRTRKIIIESEDDATPLKKSKTPEKSKKEKTPVEGAKKNVVPETKNDDNIKKKSKTRSAKVSPDHSMYDDLFESNSPPQKYETPEDLPAPKKEARRHKEKVKSEEKIPVPIKRSPKEKEVTTAFPKKRVVKRKELETFMDEDGFLVTKEVIKEIEIDEPVVKTEEPSSPKPLTPKKTNQAPTKVAPAGQAKISSFFTKRKA